MGACLSAAGGGTILEKSNGDQSAFDAMFVVDKVLGEGEFGQVKLVYKRQVQEQALQTQTSYACKCLRKGAQFKDNTLYPPLPVDTLRGEVEMMQILAGKAYCVNLESVFETPRQLLLVMECCSGGEMMEYVAKQTQDLRTEDVSRMSHQIFSAVDHCANHNVIHRDIKAEK
jgi:serine/threonine protein kinase